MALLRSLGSAKTLLFFAGNETHAAAVATNAMSTAGQAFI